VAAAQLKKENCHTIKPSYYCNTF